MAQHAGDAYADRARQPPRFASQRPPRREFLAGLVAGALSFSPHIVPTSSASAEGQLGLDNCSAIRHRWGVDVDCYYRRTAHLARRQTRAHEMRRTVDAWVRNTDHRLGKFQDVARWEALLRQVPDLVEPHGDRVLILGYQDDLELGMKRITQAARHELGLRADCIYTVDPNGRVISARQLVLRVVNQHRHPNSRCLNPCSKEERQEAAQAARRRKDAAGGYAYGAPPYGWTAKRGGLAPIQEEQEAVVMALVLRAEGHSLRQICAALDESGLRPRRAASWNSGTLSRTLRRWGTPGTEGD